MSVAEQDKRALQVRVQRVQERAVASNTRKTYDTGKLAFLRFCIFFGLCCLPPSSTTIASFVVFQSQTCSYATIKVYLAGVRDWVKRNGFVFEPWSSQFPVYNAMRGIRRELGDVSVSKLAVTPTILLRMLQFLDLRCHNDTMVWAAMLLAFFGLFRKDNITVGKPNQFNPRSNLTR